MSQELMSQGSMNQGSMSAGIDESGSDERRDRWDPGRVCAALEESEREETLS